MAKDFLREIIDADLAAGRHTVVRTRFPPEPNGYLHIGHAKSICLNFGLALEYRGTCNLRYDDTNPTKEDQEYVDSIEKDVRWLGFQPTAVLFSADYFPRMYELAEKLVRDGKAYVCDLTDEQIKEYRGSLTEPGKPSPFRSRTPDENLALLRKMKAGDFPDGHCVLRAKIDMASPNMKMRDPLLYRIRHAEHHRTGDAWCIYPMYDYAHPLEDAIEGITHSICTLEFENNRELYDWVIEHTGIQPVPHQYEFARLNLDYTVMSKRKLLRLVQEKFVNGWDDPRMPTISGLRRRGYRPEAIRAFCEMVGVAKNNSVVDIGKLEFCVRDDLNKVAPRVLAVVRPLAVTLTNWPADRVVQLDAPYFPPDIGTAGTRAVPLGARLLIERDDFQETPQKGYLRLAPGRAVRLRHGPVIQCDEVVKNAASEPVELRCTVLEDTLGGKNPSDGRKVWGVIHWLSAAHAVPAEVRLYDRLFSSARPEEGGDFVPHLNPRSLEVVAGARVEPSVAAAKAGDRFQFERVGYFAVDPDSKPGALVFNRIVTLREAPAEKLAPIEPTTPRERPENAKAKTRPDRRSPAEYRAEARKRDATLAAAHARLEAAGLPADHADVLTGDRDTVAFFDAAVAAGASPVAAARWIVVELPRVVADRPLTELPFGGAALGALVTLAESGAVTAPVAKDVLAELATKGGDPKAIVASRGLDATLDASAVDALVADVIARNPTKVAEYRGGKKGLLGFFVGQVVKAAGGKADPQLVNAAVARQLG
jgi:glutaminyl-tRNA synthetase